MAYEPHKLDSFSALLKWSYQQAWFSGTREVFKLSCERAFEGWSGRATENWESRFHLVIDEPQVDLYGPTIEDVCQRAWRIIKDAAPKEKETPPSESTPV